MNSTNVSKKTGQMINVDQDVPLIDRLQQSLSFAPHPRRADASVLLAITQEENPQILLTRRAAHMKRHAGEVSFPGGMRDPADTSNIVAALREAHEETGLNPFSVQLLGELPSERARSGIWVKPIVGLIPAEVTLVPEPEEIARIFFVSVDQLRQATPKPYPVSVHQRQYYMPSFQIEDEIIWGLTARILISLFKYGLQQRKEWPLLMNKG